MECFVTGTKTAAVFWFVLVWHGITVCSSVDPSGCPTYNVSNLYGSLHGVYDGKGLIKLDGFYYRDNDNVNQYRRHDKVDLYLKVSALSYGMTASFNTKSGYALYLDGSQTAILFDSSKCSNENSNEHICCYSTDDTSLILSIGSTAIGVMLTFAVSVQIITPLYHICCAKTCFKLCTGKNPSRLRIVSMYFWLMQWPWCVFLCVVAGLNSSGKGDYSQDIKIGLSIYIISYVFILWESYLSHERYYIMNHFSVNEFVEYVSDLRKVAPTLHLWIKAWHYTKHTDTTITTYRDQHGFKHTDTNTRKYKIKHVTYNGTQEFDYDKSEDLSENIENVEFLPGITKVQFKLDVRYGDNYTSRRIQEQRKHMIEVAKDVEYITKEFEKLSGMVKRASVLSGEKTSCWKNQPFFWFATFLGLTWPYRILYRNVTYKTKYTFTKLVYIDPPMTQPPVMQWRNGSASQLAPAAPVTVYSYFSPVVPQLPYPYNMPSTPMINNAQPSVALVPFNPDVTQLGASSGYGQPMMKIDPAPRDSLPERKPLPPKPSGKKEKKSKKSFDDVASGAQQPQNNQGRGLPPLRFSSDFQNNPAPPMQAGPLLNIDSSWHRGSVDASFGEPMFRRNPIYQDYDDAKR